jgi:hypothetical protein
LPSRHPGGSEELFSCAKSTFSTQGEEPAQRRALGQRARARVLREHTAAHRAEELEGYAVSLLNRHVAA